VFGAVFQGAFGSLLLSRGVPFRLESQG